MSDAELAQEVQDLTHRLHALVAEQQDRARAFAVSLGGEVGARQQEQMFMRALHYPSAARRMFQIEDVGDLPA